MPVSGYQAGAWRTPSTREEEFQLAGRIVASQLLVLLGSWLYLRFDDWAASALLVVALFHAAIVFARAMAAYARTALIATGIVLVSLSPIMTYGSQSGEVLYFGSAYSVDYQQYISVAYSLATNGLPFANPYWPAQPGYYHYGFTLPLAAVLRLVDLRSGGFFFYSYAFFAYAAAILVLLLVMLRMVFFTSSREWLIAVAVAVFASSYKALYGAISAFAVGTELAGYDTPIGFKTLQNDMIFGPHYIYSAIFLLYVLAILSRRREEVIGSFESLMIGLVAFTAPLINAFSSVILAAFFAGFVLVRHWRTPKRALTDRSSWVLAGALMLSYVGMRLLNVYAPGLRMARLDFDPLVLATLFIGIAINFGGLLILYLQRDRFSDPLWQISSVALCVLALSIWVLTIDQNMEGRFSISRRLGTFIVLILMINIRMTALDWRHAVVLAPALLTFLGQNYYFFASQDYSSRTVGVARELFDIRMPYRLNDAAYRASDRYRFNFDIVTGGASIEYPNSLGYRQYSPVSVVRPSPATPATPATGALNITFQDNVFTPVRSESGE